METLQRQYLAYVLRRANGKICGENGAEKILGMKRSTLYVWLKRYGLCA